MPRVLVFSPDENTPIGGIRVLYRHADILNKHGISAAVLHLKPGFRCTWFENSTPVEYYSPELLRKSEYLVLPEIYGPYSHREIILERKNILGIRKKIRLDVQGINKVIFNQNAHYTFDHYPLLWDTPDSPYLSPEVHATMVVSEHNRRFVQDVFPHHAVHRIRLGFDHNIFFYEPRKKKQIAFMPRKNAGDIQRVINALRFKGLLDGWQLTPIDGVPERRVGELLRESTFFLSFGTQEGFPLPPAEAMTCGCIVVGYHGYGASEYMEKEFAFPVHAQDIAGYVRQMESLLLEYNHDPSRLNAIARQGADYMQQRHSIEQEEEDVMAIWRGLLG